MGIVLDTSAVVDLERAGAALADSVPDRECEFFLPAIVLAELWIGVELSSGDDLRKQRLRRIRSLLQHATLIPFGDEIAPTYARIFVELRRRGTPIPSNDLAIAPTTVHHGHEVLVGTSGEAHFRKVPGLGVIALDASR